MTRIESARDLLLEARAKGSLLPGFPEDLRPASRDEALAIQDGVVAALGGPGAWKTGPRQPGHEPVFTLMPAADLYFSPATVARAWPFGPEIEVEIAVRLGVGLPPQARPYTPEALAAAIASIHPAIELVGSRFVDRKKVDPISAIADGRSNVATIVGPATQDWRGIEFADVAMRLSFDGAKVAETAGGATSAAVLDALANLANHAMHRRAHLAAGQFIITGARIRPVRVPPGTRTIAAEVTGLGAVTLELA